jgi:L-ascorbate metabolism protein UlaG (beta-lactamase superfamily)
MLSSIDHPDYAPDNTFGNLDGSLSVAGAGAYGKEDSIIQGHHVPMKYDDVQYEFGALYIFDIEDTRVCFCGPLTTTKLSDDLTQALSSVQIVFVPIGGGDVLGPDDAYEFAVSLEPNIIIPTHYDAMDSEKDALGTFLKEAGSTDTKPVEKCTTKKKEILDSNSQVIVLAAQ